MTLHGAGYGLDLVESALQQFLGAKDAIGGGSYPRDLETVVIVERQRHRLDAVAGAIRKMVDDAPMPPGWKPGSRLEFPIFPVPPPTEARATSTRAIRTAVSAVSRAPEKKRQVFVAMPFAKKMRDIWNFGIRDPVRSAGLICVRLDEEFFTGDIIERIKRKIEDAELVIADLTGDNPNVFLEVGYAWGRGRPTLFLCQDLEGREPKLPFDVGSQKCLMYDDATDLKEQLTKHLKGLGLAS